MKIIRFFLLYALCCNIRVSADQYEAQFDQEDENSTQMTSNLQDSLHVQGDTEHPLTQSEIVESGVKAAIELMQEAQIKGKEYVKQGQEVFNKQFNKIKQAGRGIQNNLLIRMKNFSKKEGQELGHSVESAIDQHDIQSFQDPYEQVARDLQQGLDAVENEKANSFFIFNYIHEHVYITTVAGAVAVIGGVYIYYYTVQKLVRNKKEDFDN